MRAGHGAFAVSSYSHQFMSFAIAMLNVIFYCNWPRYNGIRQYNTVRSVMWDIIPYNRNDTDILNSNCLGCTVIIMILIIVTTI